MSQLTRQPFAGPGRIGDEPMASTGATDEDETQAARAANRFDIRRLIGGVFVVYGLILIAPRARSARTRVKTQGRRDQHRPVDRARDADLRAR